tara:strand:- start:2779 stop:3189 length:411 start_codon:yes stop_codon:yes gene_type:complete
MKIYIKPKKVKIIGIRRKKRIEIPERLSEAIKKLIIKCSQSIPGFTKISFQSRFDLTYDILKYFTPKHKHVVSTAEEMLLKSNCDAFKFGFNEINRLNKIKQRRFKPNEVSNSSSSNNNSNNISLNKKSSVKDIRE